MNRPRALLLNQAEYINVASAKVTENKIKKWFNETSELLEENIHILREPRRVFNMDKPPFT